MTGPDDQEFWPKAACPHCIVGGIRYAPVDMICDYCGGSLLLMSDDAAWSKVASK